MDAGPLLLTLPASWRARGRLRGALAPGWPRPVAELDLAQLPLRQRLRVPVDAQRGFEVASLPAGRYVLVEPLPDQGREPIAAFELAAGEELDLGVLAPLDRGSLRITVERPDGAPVRCARPMLLHGTDPDRPMLRRAELDARGQIELAVAAGAWQVSVVCRDALPVRRSVKVLPGQLAELRISLMPAIPCTIRLEPPRNQSAPRAVLDVLDQTGIRLVREVISSADEGVFIIDLGLPAGTAQVRAVCSSGETGAATIQVEPGVRPCQFLLPLR